MKTATLKEAPFLTIPQSIYGFLTSQRPLDLYEPLRLQKLYGNIYSIDLPILPPSYILCGAPEITHVVKNTDNYIKKYTKNIVMRSIFGQGILNSSGAKFDDRRTNLLSLFKRDAIDRYINIMNDSADFYIDKIKNNINNQANNQPAIIDIQHYTNDICLDIGGKTLFNTDIRANIDDIGFIVEYFNKAYKFSPLFLYRNLRTFILSLKLRGIIKDKFFNNHQDFLEENSKSFLHYVNNYQGNPDYKYQYTKNKIDEAITLLMTGHETSATAITFALYLLLNNHSYLELVQEEINNLTTTQIGHEELKKCSYTRMLVYETLRLYPSIWCISRHSLADDEINGYHVPAKSIIYCNIFALHRNSDYWENPNQFDPFRFAPENKAKIIPNSYMPFITGPRGCVASNFSYTEIQLLLIKLLQHFDFELLPKTEIKIDPRISLRMKENLMLLAKIKDVIK